MSFHDHFSGHADVYAASRPDYPKELFEYLAGISPRTQLAWDCAAGNGQATDGLVPYFDSVLMSDASSEQISQASALIQENGLWSGVMLAESVALKDRCIDLAVVAQALHWFNLPEFFSELDRVLNDDGIFAVWSYGQHTINAECDALVHTLYEDVLGDYWPPQRKLVEAGYSGIEFPFEAVEAPDFKLVKHWSIEQVLGYLNSWSAVQRFIHENQENPVSRIESELRAAFGSTKNRTIAWPLTLIVRKKLSQ